MPRRRSYARRSRDLLGLDQFHARVLTEKQGANMMIEILAFAMWFMPHKLRLSLASKIGEPFRYENGSGIFWVVGKRTAFIEQAKFTVSRDHHGHGFPLEDAGPKA